MGFYIWWQTKAQIYSVYMARPEPEKVNSTRTGFRNFSKNIRKQIPEMFQLRNDTFRWRLESDGLQSGPESGFHNSLQVKSEPAFINI